MVTLKENEISKERLKELYVDKKLNLFRISKRTDIGRFRLMELVKEYRLTRTGKPRKYELVTRPGGYTTLNGKAYHRCVWEKINGPIPRGWLIHHINGVKSDNRLENLLAIPRGKHSTGYITEVTMKRITGLEQEISQLQSLISAYEELICGEKLPK